VHPQPPAEFTPAHLIDNNGFEQPNRFVIEATLKVMESTQSHQPVLARVQVGPVA
jgi:hypothetical protein